MPSHTVSARAIDELRDSLKRCVHAPVEAELDILKPMTPLHQWQRAHRSKDAYAIRVARLVWLVWKDIGSIWPDFHLHDYCLFFDLEPTDETFYYVNKETGEIFKYAKTIISQIDLNLSKIFESDLYSCIFVQHHSNESFVRRRFVWHQDWMPEYHLKERHYEDDFEFFKDNVCLGQFVSGKEHKRMTRRRTDCCLELRDGRAHSRLADDQMQRVPRTCGEERSSP